MLIDKLKNYFSQNGEDGIIDHLFDILNITDGTMVELGAWDGKQFSNTFYHFQKRPNMHSILIEGNVNRFNELLNNFSNDKRANCINANVSTEYNNENSLNNILENKIIGDFQLLSIDIDGKDYELWLSIDKNKFQPKIVIIEYDKWIFEANRKDFCDSFKKAGYSLVCVTGNFIFVRNDFKDFLKEEMETDPEIHFNNCCHIDLQLYLKKITPEKYNEVLKENRTWIIK